MTVENKSSSSNLSSLFGIGVILLGVVLAILALEDPADIPADKVAVLDAIRDAGFMFDSTMVEVTDEDSLRTTQVAGPMTGPKIIPENGEKPPKKGRHNYARYLEVSLAYQNDAWTITGAELHPKQ